MLLLIQYTLIFASVLLLVALVTQEVLAFTLQSGNLLLQLGTLQ